MALSFYPEPACGELVESVEGCRKALQYFNNFLSVHYLNFLIYYMIAWFYNLRLQSGALYIGATKDLEKRFAKHLAGAAGRTTSLDPPISLVYSEECESFSTARQREAQVKRWSSAKKEALVAGDKDKLRELSKSSKN